MTDGGGFVHAVVSILVRRDGHRLGDVPACGGKGQRPGDGDPVDGAEVGPHRDGATGIGGQPHGVGGGVVFQHSEGGGDDGHFGSGQRGRQLESGIVAHPVSGVFEHAGEPRTVEHDGHGGCREWPEHVADALAHRDGRGSRARPLVKARGGDRPDHRDFQRGGFPDTDQELAIRLPLKHQGQGERAAGVAAQVELGQSPQPVEHPHGQGRELIGGQHQHVQRAKPGKEVPGEGGELIAGHHQDLQRTKPREDVHGEGGQLLIARQSQLTQRAKPGKEVPGQRAQLTAGQRQPSQRAKPGEDGLRHGGVRIAPQRQTLQRAKPGEEALGQGC